MQINYLYLPIHLAKCMFIYWISPAEYPCTHGAAVKLFSGDPQSEAIFGYFFLADGGAGEE